MTTRVSSDPDEVKDFIDSMQPDVGHLIDLVNALGSAGFALNVNDYDEIIVIFGVFEVHITARPRYCDRGRWQILCDSTDVTKASIDLYDGFPRYYFTDEALVMELSAFRRKRLSDMFERGKISEGEFISALGAAGTDSGNTQSHTKKSDRSS